MMTKARIAELRQGYSTTTEANKWLNECADTIEELQIKSDFGDVAYERLKTERDQLQSRVQELEKDKARLDWLQKNGCTLMAICDFNAQDDFDGFHWEMDLASPRIELTNKDVRVIIDAAIDAAMKGNL